MCKNQSSLTAASITDKVVKGKITREHINSMAQENLFHIDALIVQFRKKITAKTFSKEKIQKIQDFFGDLLGSDPNQRIHLLKYYQKVQSLPKQNAEYYHNLLTQFIPPANIEQLKTDTLYLKLLRKITSATFRSSKCTQLAFGIAIDKEVELHVLLYLLSDAYRQDNLSKQTKENIKLFIKEIFEIDPSQYNKIFNDLTKNDDSTVIKKARETYLKKIEDIILDDWLISLHQSNDQLLAEKNPLPMQYTPTQTWMPSLVSQTGKNNPTVQQAAQCMMQEHLASLSRITPADFRRWHINDKTNPINQHCQWINSLPFQIKADLEAHQPHNKRLPVVDFYVNLAQTAFAHGDLEIAWAIQIAFQLIDHQTFKKEHRHFLKQGIDLSHLFIMNFEKKNGARVFIAQEDLFSLNNNKINLRNYLNSKQAIMPFAIVMSDLTFAKEGNHELEKIKMMGAILSRHYEDRCLLKKNVLFQIDEKSDAKPSTPPLRRSSRLALNHSLRSAYRSSSQFFSHQSKGKL